MATNAQLAITKASLLAALLKPTPDADLPACSRSDIEALHGLLSAAAARCSPANVQKCKLWMLQHLVRSPSRTAAFGKYLVAFANARPSDAKADVAATKPSVKRRRLHLLYILNDAFFHVKNRTKDQTLFAAIEPHLTALFKSAAAFADAPKHAKKLQDLIQLWQQKSYFPESFLDQLREAVTAGPSTSGAETNSETSAQVGNSAASSVLSRDAPYLLPSMHGDASTPWYDLPAANWLPVIEPNSTRPMNPSMIKPLQLASGPADKSLVEAVKKLLGDVDKIYAKDVRSIGEAPAVDISQMGEVIERDSMGAIVRGETYYGWSRAFCEKMRARRKGDAMDIDDDDRRGRAGSSRSDSRSRSRSWSRPRLRGRGRSVSRSSSRPALKKRRLSTSRSPSRNRSRSQRSYSRRRSRSYSSRSHSRTRSPRRRGQNGRESRSRSRSYSPPRALGGPSNINSHPPPNMQPLAPPMPQQQQHYFSQPALPLPPHFPGGPPPPPPSFAGGPGYMHPLPPQPPPLANLAAHKLPNYNTWKASPPPPPQHYQQGHQWPPAPPPPPGGLPQPISQGWFPPPMAGQLQGGWTGGWGPPPPLAVAPPPQSGYGYAANNNNNARGGGNGGGYQGRGGYGSGRGRGW